MPKIRFIAGFAVALLFAGWITNTYIKLKSGTYIFTDPSQVPKVQTLLVPGASVYRSGALSPVLKNRVETALYYHILKDSLPLIFSGFAIPGGYNEPVAMKDFSIARKIQGSLIHLDQGGTSTYRTIVNFKKDFPGASVLIISQQYHLPRAIMIARAMGIESYGLVAPPAGILPRQSSTQYREIFSRLKDLFLIKFFKMFHD